MRILSPDAIREKPSPFRGFYGYAIAVGVIVFIAILYSTKGIVALVKLILSNWAYIGVAIIILLFLWRFLRRKHMVVHQAEPRYERY